IVRELLHQGDTVACGGSVTLVETGVIDLLHQGGYHFLDRFQRGLSTEQVKEIYRSAFSADAFLCSANAITEDGELYNVDGNSNRVSALLYGPDSVIVVAGCNKIVKDLDGARERVRSIAAPTNAAHLKRSTPCVNSGRCEDCRCEDRICCNYVVSAQQRIKGRIKVILVGEELGY
ncbi:MAG: lactate utilization protein, partial [Clostridia bacterium]|nr:lactate utilization protein [Clostridia bacterium]